MLYDAVILGGGAAGLLCAIEAGKRGRRVLVIERNALAGRKILISGGGRCNFTNREVSAENFISQNPHFCKSALARFTPLDIIDLVNKHKIGYFEKKHGQLFCRESSRQIVEMLLAECRSARVEVRTGCSVTTVEKNLSFRLITDNGTLESRSLVVASGGLSFPKVGATDIGYRVARQFGLEVLQTRPSLVPLVFRDHGFGELAGVSLDSTVTAGGFSFRENILFTHRGLSGPAILQVSNYWDPDSAVTIDLAPGKDARKLLKDNRNDRRRLDNFFSAHIPSKVAARLFNANETAKPINQMSDAELNEAAENLNHWNVSFSKTEGFDKAEVTLGGVSTDELSSKTLESKKVPGLYFIGEVVDVTGWLGGYNFQWAWASGYAAGNSI